mmetsp:Transcript_23216/g.32507  ORF Transcript_23216/g.32507 Transcript_23216/m.32507 type:complete len:405 (+) Transcript_23216:226-1440(+)
MDDQSYDDDLLDEVSDDEEDTHMADMHQQQQQQGQRDAAPIPGGGQPGPTGVVAQGQAPQGQAQGQGQAGGQPAAQARPAGGQGNKPSNANGQANIDDEPPLDGYQRTDLIGQGAYGIVYKGTQQSTGDIVAIKRIPFADSTPEGGIPCNVIREISLLRELDHPNVVKLLDIIQARPGGLYLIFEYVAHDLKTYMDQYQTSDDINDRIGLPIPTVRNFLSQILQGVGFCHTYRILHRDLKPHNLLISADGRHVKLADFGLARLSAIPNGPYTYEVVTLWYRAPELLLGANRYSTSVDVWSVGCIFAEMATGMPLFPGRSDIDQLFKIFQRRGTPTAEMWPACLRLPHYNPEFPQWPEHPITDFVALDKLGSNNASDLLTKLLQYDPDRRLACKTALQHPYFFEQ